MEEQKSNNNLVLSGIVIESRKSDNFINATQLCKAGKKEFNHWYSLKTTKNLIKTLELYVNSKTDISGLKVVDIKVGGNHSGSWIHPDLAVQLAQWISPTFAIQVSRWIRELFITGSVSIDSRKTDEELKELQNKLEENEQKHKQEIEKISKQLQEKENINFTLKNFVENVKMKEKNQVIYIATTKMYAGQNIFKVGGVSSENRLQNRLSQYNTGRISEDCFYYCFMLKCNNFHHMENRIKEILSEFKYNKEKEMYVLNYRVLQEIISFLVENYNNEIDRLNEFMNNILQNMSRLEPIIPEPISLRDTIEIKRICNGQEIETKTIDLDDLTENERENVVNRLVETFTNEFQSNTINRKDFESYVLQKKEISFKKMTLWKTLKNISKRLSMLRLEYI